MSRTTALHDAHVAAGGELVDFAGRRLPNHFGSPPEEHQAVRTAAGVFDLSHLTVIDLEGEGALAWLRTLLGNDVGKLDDGEALYSCLCNERGGVLDDLIACRLGARHWRLIANAGARDKDLAWLEERRPADVALLTPPDTALLAVQGPSAVALAMEALAGIGRFVPAIERLERFGALLDGELFIMRTGYTGEDGVEILLPASTAAALWEALLAQGVRPCGLDARETLRIEAGLKRYGADLDEAHTPIESALDGTVDLADPERAFIGREVCEEQLRFGGCRALVGLVYTGEGRREFRPGQSVQLAGRDVGVITSATFSPTRQLPIALARVERPFKGNCDVVIDGHPLPARTEVMPFVRPGQASD